MRTHTGRPHDVRRVGSYENVPRLCLLCSEELPPLTGALPLGQGSVTPAAQIPTHTPVEFRNEEAEKKKSENQETRSSMRIPNVS